MCYTSLIPAYNSAGAQEKEHGGVTDRAEWPSGTLSFIPSFPVGKETFFIGVSASKTVTALLLNPLEVASLCEGHLKSRSACYPCVSILGLFSYPLQCLSSPLLLFHTQIPVAGAHTTEADGRALSPQQASPAVNFIGLNQINRISVGSETLQSYYALNSSISYSLNLTRYYKIITLDFSLLLVGSVLGRNSTDFHGCISLPKLDPSLQMPPVMCSAVSCPKKSFTYINC